MRRRFGDGFRGGSGRLLLAAAVWGAAVVAASASSQMTGLSVAPKSGVQIEITGYYDQLPPGGMAPIQVRIRNDTKRSHTWRFTFSSDGNYGSKFSQSYSWSASVPGGEQKTFDLLVPLVALSHDSYSYPSLNVKVDGHGITYGQASYAGSSKYSGNKHTPFAGLSRSLAVHHRGELEKALEADGVEFQGCELEREWLSDDWRAYLGFATLWFTEAEWDQAPTAARQAIQTWVAHGGTLIYVTRTPQRELSQAGFPVEGRGKVRLGLGTLEPFAWDGQTLDIKAAASLIRRTAQRPLNIALLEAYGKDWSLRSIVGETELHAVAIILAILIFAFTVGPVNLIWLAGKTRRHRLFVTTPLISVGASLILLVIILFQDGVGGEGSRAGLMLLLPGQNNVLQVQEQLSRTGVMLDQRHPLDADVYLAPIVLYGNQERDRSLTRSPEGISGEWFGNRSVQAQYLARRQPSRARVEWVNAGSEEAPELVSTLEQPLTGVFLVDDEGAYWFAETVRAGERTRMKSSSVAAWKSQWWKPMKDKRGIRNLGVEGDWRKRRNHVFAFVEEAEGMWMPGPDSIDWSPAGYAVVGPVVQIRKGAS